jgi:hypothetical protein
LTDIPDDQLAEILPAAKKIAAAIGAENYNILQNNGRLAHQVVDHVRYALYPDILDIRHVSVDQRTLFGPPNHVLGSCHRTRLICSADKCLLADVYVMNVC